MRQEGNPVHGLISGEPLREAWCLTVQKHRGPASRGRGEVNGWVGDSEDFISSATQVFVERRSGSGLRMNRSPPHLGSGKGDMRQACTAEPRGLWVQKVSLFLASQSPDSSLWESSLPWGQPKAGNITSTVIRAWPGPHNKRRKQEMTNDPGDCNCNIVT